MPRPQLDYPSGGDDAGKTWVVRYLDGNPERPRMRLETPAGGGGGDMLAANNLSDVDDPATARDNLGVEIGVDVQGYDTDLAALAGLASAGLVARTGAGTVSARTITGTAGRVGVTNGDGVSGNPTLDVLGALLALGGLTPAADRLGYFDGASSAALATFTALGRELAKSVRQDVADTDATIAAATRLLVLTSLTATRTQTLPAANAVAAGTPLWVHDGSGSASSSVKISIARAGSDTINGGTSPATIEAPYGQVMLVSDGSTKWLYPAAVAAAQTLSSPTVNNGQHNNGKFKASTEDTSTQSGVTGTVTLDCSTSNVHKVIAGAGDVTIAFSNVPATGNMFSLTLTFKQDSVGGRALNFPAAVKWNGGTVPSVSTTANAESDYELYTMDGGTTWKAGQIGKDWA